MDFHPERAQNRTHGPTKISPRRCALLCFFCILLRPTTATSTETGKRPGPSHYPRRFREGHPDEGTLDGVCTPDMTRTVMNCDIYNGIAGWAVSEVTFVVTWSPYNEDDKRYYSEHVSIDPQKTERVPLRLGLQLPLDSQLRNNRGLPIGPPMKHWGWSLVGAKGHQVH